MKNQLTNAVKQNWDTTKTVTANIVEFVDAVCLGVVSGYAIYVYTRTDNPKLWDYVLGFAGLAIAFQAFKLLIRAFNKQPR